VERLGYAPAMKTDVRIRDLRDECPSWETARVIMPLEPM
jgi:hypothetical protein